MGPAVDTAAAEDILVCLSSALFAAAAAGGGARDGGRAALPEFVVTVVGSLAPSTAALAGQW